MPGSQDVCIVTDSTADIPRAVVDELGITVVPLSFTIEGRTFVDGEIPMAQFFERMKASSALPTTSQPPVGAFVEAFNGLLERCKEVVCISISGRLSGTLDSALDAARLVGDRVHVLDSRNLSWGEGFQVIQAARAAAAGATIDEVKRVAEHARQKMHIIVGLDSLENLAKGGRVGRASAFVGGMLNIKVLITVDAEGALALVSRTRGTKAALQSTLDWVLERIDTSKRIAVAVLHSGSRDNALWLEEQARARLSADEFYVIETGPVIGTHTGTGWGLAAVELD